MTKNEIRRLRKKGLSYQQIGKELGTNKQAVWRKLNYKPHPIKKPTLEEEEEIYTITGHSYYCLECYQYFLSKLPVNEAICKKCGGKKITTK